MKKVLLLDSNILQYGVSPDYASEVIRVVETLVVRGFDPVIASYTYFEVYRGLAKKKIPAMKSLVDQFASVDVDLPSFKIAASITTCYMNHGATKAFADSYSIGDTILRAAGFRYGFHILTGNGNDFPFPFFDDVSRDIIRSRSKKVAQEIVLKSPNLTAYKDACAANFKS